MNKLDFIAKPPNFYEWLKVRDNGGGTPEPGNIPLYKLAGNSDDLPLTEGNGYIPSVGSVENQDFYARAYAHNLYNDDPQIYSVDNSLYIAHAAAICCDPFDDTPNDFTEFTIKFKFSSLTRDNVYSPRYGYEFMYAGSHDNEGRGTIDIFIDEDNNRFYIVLQRGHGAPTLDVSGYTTGTTSNGLYFSDIDFEWLQNNGDGHDISIVMQNNVIYCYIDNVLFCHQDYYSDTKYEAVSIGTRFDPTFDYGAACVKVDYFELYDIAIIPE